MSEVFAANYFDSKFYLKNNPDVLAAVERSEFTSAYDHFLKFGQFEKRAPNTSFDATFYLTENPDVLAAVNQGTMKSAREHFVNFGVKEGRSAGSFEGSFNEAAYLEANPDVAAAVQKGDFVSGYAHYMLFGAKEGRPAYGGNGEPVMPGETFILTEGKDTFVGTNGSDTFVAEGYSPSTSAPQTQLNILDSIDGGAGIDTLNITVADNGNKLLAGTVKNVEIINIDNMAATAAAAHSGSKVDASKFQGATEIWQIGKAATVTKLADTTTAGFRSVGGALSVEAADKAVSAKVALDEAATGAMLTVSGKTLASVAVSGALESGPLDLTVKAGTDVTAVSVNTALETNLTVTGSGAAKVTKVDASASAGKIAFEGGTDTATILSGSGDDTLTLATQTAKDKIAAELGAGSGNDKITVNTSGDGTTTINAGEGNDIVGITGRSTGRLTVNLGAGDDTFNSDVVIKGTDVIDAGEGIDTLMLSLVGSANVGAFKNFDVFDVMGLAKTLDVAILSKNNDVAEFVGSGSVGAHAKLLNLGEGIGFRATADMGGTTLALDQKTAGSLTVTLDADEKEGESRKLARMSIDAVDAKSLDVVFDTSYLATEGNVSTIKLSGVAASLSVVSGGENSSNVLDFTSTGNMLTKVTVTGENALALDITDMVPPGASNLETVDASGLTGGLTFNLVDLKDGGLLILGGGKDIITIGTESTTTGAESIFGLGADDELVLTGVTGVTGDAAGPDSYTIANGVLTFEGAGPATFEEALTLVDGVVAASTAVVFEYLNDSYLFSQGGATDTLVKLADLTGMTSFAMSTAEPGHFLIG